MAFGGEGERFLLVIERWRTKSLWQQEREDIELFFVVMVEQGFFVWFNHFARFCFPVFGQAGLDFVLGRIVGVDSLMVFWCVERNPSYLSFGISISTPTVLEFLQILFSLLWRTGLDIYHCFSEGSTYQVNNVSIYIYICNNVYIYIYMGIYTYKYAVFSPSSENNLRDLGNYPPFSMTPLPPAILCRFLGIGNQFSPGLVLTAEVSAAPQ